MLSVTPLNFGPAPDTASNPPGSAGRSPSAVQHLALAAVEARHLRAAGQRRPDKAVRIHVHAARIEARLARRLRIVERRFIHFRHAGLRRVGAGLDTNELARRRTG